MTADPHAEIPLENLSLEQLASLTSGRSTWQTTGITGSIKPLTLSDGPHGIRKQNPHAEDSLALATSVPATCFPPAVTLGSSWDPELAGRVGAALAREASALGVDVILGPGVNIKRSPLCGRNFEYFSEDPHVSGIMGAALVNGIQSRGIGACVKHFAANNQETDRMRVSADVDERTLREIYLPAFEHVVKQAKPYTVMCSYNKLNGVYTSQNHWLLTEVLRDEWGFDGLVMSDWGAVNDRVAALAAGLDLEMPPTGTDAEIVTAVEDGRLDRAVVMTAGQRLVELGRRVARAERYEDWDVDAHHELAREAARAGVVLLKNDGDLLPLDPAARQKVAVIGELARTPRYQGQGSSHVVPTRLDTAWDALHGAVGPDTELTFSPGYPLLSTDLLAFLEPDEDRAAEPSAQPADNADLLADAVTAAQSADVAVLFLGLPDISESEGKDRTTIDLPAEQIALLRAVSEVCSRTVVVLANGGVVSVSEWQDTADAVLEGWLGGQAGGTAIADLLLGSHSPSGRLTESIPHRLADVPSHLFFPGTDGHVVHGEGRYVGYRHYDTLGADVAYPFGHGLTYSRFDYSDLEVEKTGENAWAVSATITNSGRLFAEEVAQLYVAFDETHPTRPRHELRGFTKIGLAPGESGVVRFALTGRDLAWWSASRQDWRFDAGTFTVEIGASSRDIRLRAQLVTPGDNVVEQLGPMSTLGTWLTHPVGSRLIADALGQSPAAAQLTTANPLILEMARAIPLAKFEGFNIGLTAEVVATLVEAAQQTE
ncbi:glycoside hydrolase family 3 C-terminal domain-containing protein [Streptomyces sp. NPDC051963]|uniref:glycoside hydrolase family 3 C-terminal domain-containing protein n=1 Tax=Streptomyces sp. NPDC051963 TaxID=3365678 RepID=UPI0037D7CD78